MVMWQTHQNPHQGYGFCKGMKPVILISTLLLPSSKPWGSTLLLHITTPHSLSIFASNSALHSISLSCWKSGNRCKRAWCTACAISFLGFFLAILTSLHSRYVCSILIVFIYYIGSLASRSTPSVCLTSSPRPNDSIVAQHPASFISTSPAPPPPLSFFSLSHKVSMPCGLDKATLLHVDLSLYEICIDMLVV